MTLSITIIALLVTVVVLIYKYATKNFDYWKKRGIPYPKPVPLFGNLYEIATFQKQFGLYLRDLYNQFQSPCFGIFVFNKPHLVIKDPELIKLITVKDFNVFSDRISLSDEECDSISSKFLFFVKNPEWKIMRSKVSPVFSSGKIKNMVSLINEAAEDMKTYLEKHLNCESIEAKEICAKFSTDVIATCAFGIRSSCFEYENAEFRAIGRKTFDFRYGLFIRQLSYVVCPELIKLLKLPFLDTSVTDFIRDVFWKTLRERERGNYKRNDLIDILIHIKNTWVEEGNIKFEGDRVVAQAGQFYLAGFETVASTMGFALYELCLNKTIQNKVRSEVQSVTASYGGFTFEALSNMKYLQMVIHETLRKYPVLAFLDRRCSEDYKIPNSDYVIEKGTPVFIPLFGLQYDPEYFPNPEQFDPERFVGEENENSSSFVYMPFGKGPRNCIGARFALTVLKISLAQIISTFEVERSHDTPVPLQFHCRRIFLASRVGLPMKFKKI